jgi:[ribosomal protein S18]-alanine N-acetyltransferase
MDPKINIRIPTTQDLPTIGDLLVTSPLIHRHLDWRTVLEWYPNQPFLIAEQDKKVTGLLVCPTDPDGISWIRCFASNNPPLTSEIWNLLLEAATIGLHQKVEAIYAVGLLDWFCELLSRSNFKIIQSVVVLKWNNHLIHPPVLDDSFFVRPMESGDILPAADVDLRSFEPRWVLSPQTMEHAFVQAEHSVVIEKNNKVIAYSLTTANHFSAHLARIAVLPEFQGLHLGSTLIHEMLLYFRNYGIHNISVNTQNDNSSSLALYKNSGFELTGESYPIYQFDL